MVRKRKETYYQDPHPDAERRQGFDEISRAIGNLEGKVDNLANSTNAQWDKLESIEKRLTAQGLKVAGIAGAIGAAIAFIPHIFKLIFSKGGGG